MSTNIKHSVQRDIDKKSAQRPKPKASKLAKVETVASVVAANAKVTRVKRKAA